MVFTPAPDLRRGPQQDLTWLRRLIDDPANGWSEHVVVLSQETCPHRTAESIAQQIQECPPWEQAQRIRAKWEGPSSDRRMVGFSGQTICDDMAIPEHAVHVHLACDHGEREGAEVWHLILYWRDPIDHKARTLTMDEYVSPGRTTVATDAAAVVEMLARHGLTLQTVDRCRGDVNTAGKSSSMRSINQEFENAFAASMQSHSPPFPILVPAKGPGSVEYGARVLNLAMLDGRHRIHERCAHAIRAYQTWRGTDSGHDADLKHHIDTERYGVVDLHDPVRASAAGEIRVI